MIMTSPARRHIERKAASLAGVVDRAAERVNASAYELMLVSLKEDMRHLKTIQSIVKKVEAKRQMLPKYDAWCAGVMDSDAGLQDEVFTTVLCWRIDAGDFAGAIPMAEYAIRHKLTLPDRFARSLPCLLAEEVADNALKGDTVPLDALRQIGLLTLDEDMPDEVRAKLHKAIGYAERETDPASALENLKLALQLHDKVGVKKDIERLERELKRNVGEPDSASPN